jgi:pyruvate dehydrogenase E2 component (dihydrolipoamide acetyltransferase)
MASAVLMPRPGQMTEECTVQAWMKKEGDDVRKGDVLFEIETDKSNMEVEAFEEGTLLRILAPEGATVPVNTVVAWIGQPGEEVPEAEAPAQPVAVPSEAAPSAGAVAETQMAEAPVNGVGVAVAEPGGAAAESDAAARPEGPAQAAPSPARRGRHAISPRASRVAAELGVDVSSLTGSGPGGRIVERDVRAAAAAQQQAPAPQAPAGVAPPPTAAPGEPGQAPAHAAAADPGAPQQLSRLRQVIARRLTESVTTIPHFSVTVAVDMTALVALRAELRGQGSPITLTDFVHAATVQSLVEFPFVNSRTDGRSVWMRESVHLGIAVSVPGGLLVPVVRDAQTLGIGGLRDRSVALIEGARAGRLGPDELSGSTFTVSNMGMFGVEQFTAIINPGESGILAVSSIAPQAAVIGDGLAVRQVMRLTLSADHRLVDGEMGARFLNALRRRLQDVEEQRAALLQD